MANYFSIFLVAVTLASGLIWLADSLLWAPKRKEKVALAKANTQGVIDDDTLQEIAPLPYIVDTAQQIFPVIAFVMVLRSFLYEPFQIPSGSMMPTLLVGDFILVEKFTYGLKDPVARNKFVEMGKPERGDVVVFKYPEQPSVDYIKRVVGLPGDKVIYRNKQVYIKPACDLADITQCPVMAPVGLKQVSRGEFFHAIYNGQRLPQTRYTESLGEVSHDILVTDAIRAVPEKYHQQPGTLQDKWLVPDDQYFVLGDNRDNSRDGRYWGFVPDANLVGKAVAIWISFEFERPADSWLPGFIPSGVRFERVGAIK